MFIKKSIKILVISLAFLVLPVAIFAVPQFPHLFYGTLTINNEIAKEGITINAYDGYWVYSNAERTYSKITSK